MRRVAMMASVLLVSGCAGSGFWGFLGDSITLPGANPNAPSGGSETMKRVRTEPADMPLLLQEPGNVWPGPPPPEPTLQDVEKQQSEDIQKQMGAGGGTVAPGAGTGGTNGLLPAPPGHRQPTQGGDSTGAGVDALPPSLRSYLQAKPGTGSASTPGKGGTIMVPNGNGTSTVIGPDGSVTTVPTPTPKTP